MDIAKLIVVIWEAVPSAFGYLSSDVKDTDDLEAKWLTPHSPRRDPNCLLNIEIMSSRSRKGQARSAYV
jgi:hypothetical protein